MLKSFDPNAVIPSAFWELHRCWWTRSAACTLPACPASRRWRHRNEGIHVHVTGGVQALLSHFGSFLVAPQEDQSVWFLFREHHCSNSMIVFRKARTQEDWEIIKLHCHPHLLGVLRWHESNSTFLAVVAVTKWNVFRVERLIYISWLLNIPLARANHEGGEKDLNKFPTSTISNLLTPTRAFYVIPAELL